MIPRHDETRQILQAVPQIAHALDVARIDAVIAGAHEVVARQAWKAVGRHAADVFGIDAVIAERDQRVDGSETVAEARHAPHVVERDAVFGGADHAVDVGLLIAGRRQLIEPRDADILNRQLVLLLRGRRADAALRQLRREGGVRLEDVGPAADAAAADAVDGERSALAPDGEVNRAVRARDPRARQRLELRDAASSGRATNGRCAG